VIPVPAQNSFTTLKEAHIILANGVFLEYRQQPKHDLGGAWSDTYENQAYLKTQLLALDNLWAGKGAERSRPAILNQAIDSLAIYDPLESTQSLQDDIREIWTTVEKACPWDEYQIRALRASRKFHDYVGIIEGGAGNGKTTAMAGIAVSYACSGCPVILCAPTVAPAIAVKEAVVKVDGRSQSPGLNVVQL
jgi:AAA domain